MDQRSSQRKRAVARGAAVLSCLAALGLLSGCPGDDARRDPALEPAHETQITPGAAMDTTPAGTPAPPLVDTAPAGTLPLSGDPTDPTDPGPPTGP
jgi:hypothetical protein